jgi:hypothetical protein
VAKKTTYELTAEERELRTEAAAKEYALMKRQLQSAIEAANATEPEARLQADYELHALLLKAARVSARRLSTYDARRNCGGSGPLSPAPSVANKRQSATIIVRAVA